MMTTSYLSSNQKTKKGSRPLRSLLILLLALPSVERKTRFHAHPSIGKCSGCQTCSGSLTRFHRPATEAPILFRSSLKTLRNHRNRVHGHRDITHPRLREKFFTIGPDQAHRPDKQRLLSGPRKRNGDCIAWRGDDAQIFAVRTEHLNARIGSDV